MVPKWSHSSPLGLKHNLDSGHVEQGNLSQDISCILIVECDL